MHARHIHRSTDLKPAVTFKLGTCFAVSHSCFGIGIQSIDELLQMLWLKLTIVKQPGKKITLSKMEGSCERQRGGAGIPFDSKDLEARILQCFLIQIVRCAINGAIINDNQLEVRE